MVRAEEGAQSRVWYDFVCKLLCLGLLGSRKTDWGVSQMQFLQSVLGADACSALTLLLPAEVPSRLLTPVCNREES